MGLRVKPPLVDEGRMKARRQTASARPQVHYLVGLSGFAKPLTKWFFHTVCVRAPRSPNEPRERATAIRAHLPDACDLRVESARILASSLRGSCASPPHPSPACSAARLPPSPSLSAPATRSSQARHRYSDRQSSLSKWQRPAHPCSEPER